MTLQQKKSRRFAKALAEFEAAKKVLEEQVADIAEAFGEASAKEYRENAGAEWLENYAEQLGL